jgi:hypothetical protein
LASELQWAPPSVLAAGLAVAERELRLARARTPQLLRARRSLQRRAKRTFSFFLLLFEN